MTGYSDNNRSEGQGGCREALSTKEVRSKGTTVGTRTGSEAAMRAMSVRVNAKSNSHQKTHRVEPDGTGRKSMHLTWGGLSRESGRGVSRGRSSEESRGNSEGAKGQRTSRGRSTDRLRENGAKSPETTQDQQLRQVPVLVKRTQTGGLRCAFSLRAASHSSVRKEAQDDA